MSKRLQQNKHFLQLLLNTSQDQSRAILKSLTPEQLVTIIEIFSNLSKISSISPETKHLICKRQRLCRRLTDKNLNLQVKNNLVHKHTFQVLHTLMSARKLLLKLLK